MKGITHRLKYRVAAPGIPPRKTVVKIPGWIGKDQPRADGLPVQPWYCPPIMDGVGYGVELIYPLKGECRVSKVRGKVRVRGEFGEPQNDSIKWPPFGVISNAFYGFNTHIDLKVEAGYALRIEPHPRFYYDPKGSVPVPVVAHLATNWWPMFFFIIFKAPTSGQEHVFRFGEPYAQLLVVPDKATYELTSMDQNEAAERELQTIRIMNERHNFPLKQYTPKEQHFEGGSFGDGLYWRLKHIADKREKG